jgi:hypothetical protein
LIEAQRAAEISRIASTYLDRLQQLIKRLSEWKNTSNNDAFASLLQNMYGNEKLLHSKSLKGNLVETIRHQDGVVAASAALAVALKESIPFNKNQPTLSSDILHGAARMRSTYVQCSTIQSGH